MKILVVDDSKAMRLIVTRTLRQAGYADAEVVEADSGVTGLAAVSEHDPALVLSDWNMPECSGIDFLRRLRASGSTVTFGFVTSEGTDDMRAEAAGAGAQFLVAKPFTPEQLGAAITEHARGPAMTAGLVARVPVPHAKDWKDLLEGLLGRDVSVAPGDPVIPKPGSPCMVALYTDKRMQLQAVAVADLTLSAAIGSSLGLLPPSSVAEAVSAGVLTEGQRENTHEVFNVGASTFNKGDAHLALYQAFAPGHVPPVDASVLLRTLGRRLDLGIEVQGYGKGRLSVVLNAR